MREDSAVICRRSYENGKVEVGGDGNAKMSFTGREDVARFVVHVLTSLGPEETVGKTFRIEVQRLVRSFLPLPSHLILY